MHWCFIGVLKFHCSKYPLNVVFSFHSVLLFLGGVFFFRFMICCDRCEEWFHGDCVGISEARGRLLERNGEDYICPNCTILQGQDEPVSELDQQEAKVEQGNVDGTEFTSIGTIEQKSVEDQGIKGRIEKAANPSGKKKLKIFQPVSILIVSYFSCFTEYMETVTCMAISLT